MDYEVKYKFIDLDKLHERVQFLQVKFEASEHKGKLVENELYDLRDKILKATSSQLRKTGMTAIDGKPIGGNSGTSSNGV